MMTTIEMERIATPVHREPRESGKGTAKISVQNFDFYYGSAKVLHSINLEVPDQQVTALIGPSGCGKTTFLRSINRLNDIIPGTHVSGAIRIDGDDVYGSRVDVVSLR